jgi:hypothetical protein
MLSVPIARYSPTFHHLMLSTLFLYVFCSEGFDAKEWLPFPKH